MELLTASKAVTQLIMELVTVSKAVSNGIGNSE